MGNQSQTSASCLCGSVTMTATQVSRKLEACHCSMCRKWGGGPALVVDCGNEVEIDGVENVTVYNSSDWAERGFCSVCGTHLFYRLKDSNQHIIPAGFFSDIGELEFEKQIFIDEKPDYYSFANETEAMTGVEVFAQFANPD